MNEEKFETVGTENEKKVTLAQKLKKLGIATLKVVIPMAAGVAAGYVARKFTDKDIYADAKAQREYLERKSKKDFNN